MKKSIRLTIPGNPIAKARPRFARRGKFTTTYSSQETEEGKFLWEIRQQHNGELLQGALAIHLEFFFSRPKGHYGTGCNAGVLKKSAPEYHIIKPDNDNLQKFVKDCLNGEAYKDDCQIVFVTSQKAYVGGDGHPYTKIFINELQERV